MSSSVCPTCSCTEIDIVDVSGEAVCVNCGTILEENNIVSSIEFHESGGGAHSVVGQFVSSTSSKSYGNIGTSGRNYGMESRANTLANGKKKIRQIAGMLRLGDHYVDSAFRLFALALQRNFTHGRKAQTVIAACLYIVCRRERSPHLLIDFSDKLQINVYVLGGVFLKFCKLLQIHLPLIDPSLYIHRFASQLNFAGKTHSIATTALRLVATMKRDWIETGRRPSGICGAALLIAARSQSVMCSLHDVMDVVNIGERTLKQRLYEFSLTPTAQLTYDQVGKLEMSRVECDPPSFQRHREKEVMEMLLLESERLPLENGRKRTRKATEDDNDEDDDEDEEDSLSDSDEMDSKTKKMKDEEMSRFLSGDAYYKKKHASALLSSTSGNGAGSSGLKGDDKKILAAAALEDDDDDIDYGFENANEQIVNRASRLAAQEVLLRVRKKSARYIIRKREEADFYKTIERDLTLALEEEGSSIVKATLSSVMKEKKNDTESDGRRRTVSPGGGDSDLEDEIGDEDGDADEEEVDEEVEDAEDEDDEEETKPVSASRPESELSNGNTNGKDERSQDQEDEQEKQQEDNFSDLDDEEINSLLLTKEEADKKKILWEKMNKDFIQEQEEKRLNCLNAPEVPKKKRRKKIPDANVPPPDTAQHAIYGMIFLSPPLLHHEPNKTTRRNERRGRAKQTVHTSSSKSARKKQEVNMATPNFARANQEMPPAGGFKPVKSVRGVPAVRGPPGWFMFLGSFALTSFGFYLVGQHNQNHRKLAAEERERRISMLPFLQAEADVEFLAQQEKVLEEERKIMKDVPGWTVGESTYHSDRYTVPLYAQKK